MTVARQLGELVRKTVVVSANFTRPNDTTAYASGDLVANNTTAGSVAAMSLAVARNNDYVARLRRVRLLKSNATITNAQFRVHFYRTSPLPPSNGDNGAWLTPHATWLGSIDVTIDKAFTDGSRGVASVPVNSEILLQPGSGLQTVFALLEARAAYTPAANEVFTLECEVEQE